MSRDEGRRSATWLREGYPIEGEPVTHEHGAGGVGHTHVGGDLRHGHRHRRIDGSTFADEFYLSDDARPCPHTVTTNLRCNACGAFLGVPPWVSDGASRCPHCGSLCTGESDGCTCPDGCEFFASENARDALAHARQHNEHATRPNQHDESWAAGDIECPAGDLPD